MRLKDLMGLFYLYGHSQHGHSHKNAQINVPACMSHHTHVYSDSTCNYATDLKLVIVWPCIVCYTYYK